MPVARKVWAYDVSRMPVLAHWCSHLGRDGSCLIIGDRIQPSPLGEIQPEGSLA
jgi:hypothetical protein